jgi:hypothetical protein
VGRKLLSVRAALAACVFIAALSATSAVATSGPASQASAKGRSVDTVVVVIAPFLTWQDLSAERAPELVALAEQGAVGNMNCVTEDDGWPTVAGGALTMASSRWAAGPTDAPATPQSAVAIRAANADSLNPPELGALGDVLRSAGLRTAAIGCSDADTSTPRGISSPAALLACDKAGRIDLDFTGSPSLAPSKNAPFGAVTSPSKVASAMASALQGHASLIVVDTGDLSRAHDATGLAEDRYEAAHLRAVRTASALTGLLAKQLKGRDSLLLVVSPATDKPYYEPPYFGPTVALGSGLSGTLRSGSTHRPGLVTNLDVAPTILSALGLKSAPGMLGQPMTASTARDAAPARTGGAPLSSRVAALRRLGASVGAIDYARDLLFIRRFAPLAAGLALALALLDLLPVPSRLRRLAAPVAALVFAIPAGSWLMFAFVRYPTSPDAVLFACFAAAFVVLGLAYAVAALRRWGQPGVWLGLSALTALAIAADQWAGSPVESGLFSYSIRAGWRYYGIGNEGAALLVGSSLAAAGLLIDLARGGRREELLRKWLIPATGIVALLTIAAPSAGANAGAAIWGVVAYAAAWAHANRIPLTWKSVGAALLGVAAAVAAVAVADMRSEASRTHIGRFFAEIAHGDFSEVWALVARKAANNIGYIPLTPYTWVAVAFVVALVAARWLGDRPLRRTLAEQPGLATALIGVVAGAVTATFTEDSGVVMPALMLFAGALPALALAARPEGAASSQPDLADTPPNEGLTLP